MSVVITWADTLLGLMSLQAIAPRAPVTLGLEVHLYAPITGLGAINLRGELSKQGKAISNFTVKLSDDRGNPLGIGHGTFMAAPDPDISLPTGDWALKGFVKPGDPLERPVAERVTGRRWPSAPARDYLITPRPATHCPRDSQLIRPDWL